MLKIDSEKIWNLLKKDSTIQKRLAKYIFEEEASVNHLQSIYDKQVILLENLEARKLKIEKEEQHYKYTITRRHGDISFLEIRLCYGTIVF